MIWFVLAAFLMVRKAFSTASEFAYSVDKLLKINTVCLQYVILEMHSFPMSAAKHFHDNPLSIYLDPKIVLIYCRHSVYVHLYSILVIFSVYHSALTRIPIPSRVYLIDAGNEGRARDSRTP
jgi:hypothetical protein